MGVEVITDKKSFADKVSDHVLAATLQDVGDVAAFVVSDRARTMTASTVNISCGAIVDRPDLAARAENASLSSGGCR